VRRASSMQRVARWSVARSRQAPTYRTGGRASQEILRTAARRRRPTAVPRHTTTVRRSAIRPEAAQRVWRSPPLHGQRGLSFKHGKRRQPAMLRGMNPRRSSAWSPTRVGSRPSRRRAPRKHGLPSTLAAHPQDSMLAARGVRPSRGARSRRTPGDWHDQKHGGRRDPRRAVDLERSPTKPSHSCFAVLALAGEPRQDVAARRAPRRLRIQELGAQVVEVPGNRGPPRARPHRHRLRRSSARFRRRAGERLVEHDPDGVPIARFRDHAAAPALGRHVARRAGHFGVDAAARFDGETEVEQDDAAARLDENVGRLHVAMELSRFVNSEKPLGELHGGRAQSIDRTRDESRRTGRHARAP
jgi:hypothetical protein